MEVAHIGHTRAVELHLDSGANADFKHCPTN